MLIIIACVVIEAVCFFCSRLSWFDGSGMGFCLEYPSISLHAISRDLTAYPQEHLYVMVNAKLSGEAHRTPLCLLSFMHHVDTSD